MMMKNIQCFIILILVAFAANVLALDVEDIESISMQVMDENEGGSNAAFRMLTLPGKVPSRTDKKSASGLSRAKKARMQQGADEASLLDSLNSVEAQEVKKQAKENSKAAKRAAKEARDAAKENAERATKRGNENKKKKKKKK